MCACAVHQFFAVDLGGSNLRVVSVGLDGAGGITDFKEWKVSACICVCAALTHTVLMHSFVFACLLQETIPEEVWATVPYGVS